MFFKSCQDTINAMVNLEIFSTSCKKNNSLGYINIKIFLLKLGGPTFLCFKVSVFEIEYSNILARCYDEIPLPGQGPKFYDYFHVKETFRSSGQRKATYFYPFCLFLSLYFCLHLRDISK